MERNTKALELELKSIDNLWIQVAGTKCNLSCAHCFISCGPDNNSHKIMSIENVRDIVEQGIALGVKEFYFTGGEPFLHPDIKELIELVLAKAPLTVLTNGTLLTEKMVIWLKEIKEKFPSGLELRISLDGYKEEENDSIRGKGNYEKIMQSIARLSQNGINPIITLTEVKSQLSCPALQEEFRNKLTGMGIANPRLKFLSPLRMGREKNRLRGYLPEENLCNEDISSLKLEKLQCNNCRAVTSEGVFPCPLLINEPGARIGDTLEEGLKPIHLSFQACYTCYHSGLTCSNEKETKSCTSYLETTHNLYKEAALKPDAGLCCVGIGKPYYPGLNIPDIMHEMNYGCGTTVRLNELKPHETVLYVGVGGGLEALQFAYATRRPNSVIAVDRVSEMLSKAKENFETAARMNDWFDPGFIRLLKGDALELPLENGTVDVAAQNCLFNIFKQQDLHLALLEMRRVLKKGGRLYMSDPITTVPIPEHLKNDEKLRAMCLSGALTFEEYINSIIEAGFGTIEVRSKRPYRLLDKVRYKLDNHILLESLEVVAYNDPIPKDGACVFVGETVIYTGEDEYFDDGRGHIIQKDVPLPVCQKTANNFRELGRDDLYVTEKTFHYAGGGCC